MSIAAEGESTPTLDNTIWLGKSFNAFEDDYNSFSRDSITNASKSAFVTLAAPTKKITAGDKMFMIPGNTVFYPGVGETRAHSMQVMTGEDMADAFEASAEVKAN
ncbi:hypothetical protein BJY00DRAFT_320234 [Aspergillus carlsbadensis]|nr:hypothetical protein BJY00DRAFT_320234 [Aspergillus carlsbadensis]